MADPRRSGTPVVLVAIIGLLSTVVASALAGYWANRGVERQLESQRSADLEDSRRDAYERFLRATTEACDAQGRGEEKEINSAALEVLNLGAVVFFLAGSDLDEVAGRFVDGVIDGSACSDTDSYAEHWNAFVLAAQSEL
jgi:hypothetical protein